MTAPATGFVLPPYPYDRLTEVARLAAARFGAEGGLVDCSVGTPCDPPPPAVVEALATSGTERGYPASIGSAAYRNAAGGWLAHRFGVPVDPSREVAACVGTKELVASTAHYLHLRSPDLDTVLYPVDLLSHLRHGGPAGRLPGGSRPRAPRRRPRPRRRPPRRRRPCPAALDQLAVQPHRPAHRPGSGGGVGESRGVPVFSDECYAEFTWAGPPRTVLSSGVEGVVAVHSLSKRSNLAGVRAGFYAGDPELVAYLEEIRKHAGLMVPGPVQAAGAVAFDDDAHVEVQRDRYRRRLALLRDGLEAVGLPAPAPEGGFYLWVPVPASVPGGGWGLTERLALAGGLLVSPGEFYGPDGAGFVRVAVVQPTDRLELVIGRLAGTDLTV